MALREVEKLEPSNERSVEIALELKLGRISCHPVATDTGRRKSSLKSTKKISHDIKWTLAWGPTLRLNKRDNVKNRVNLKVSIFREVLKMFCSLN